MISLPFGDKRHKTGFPLHMTHDERKDVANDLIGFLAGWGISRGDAEAILGTASAQIRELSAEQFIRSGDGVRAFNNLANPEGHS